MKIFSFHRHDFRTCNCGKSFLDGGMDYHRCSNGKLKESEIKDIISDIREQFTWTKNYDENNNRLEESVSALLKDLTDSHICGILSYFTNRLYNKSETLNKEWCIIHDIFIQELDYRIKNNIIQLQSL